MLAISLDVFKSGRLKFILSPEYEGDFSKYVDHRISKLEISQDEQKLSTSVEYLGYKDEQWRVLFDELSKAGIFYKPRTGDADVEFRCAVVEELERNQSNFINYFHIEDQVKNVVEMANDKTAFFQRDQIKPVLLDEVVEHTAEEKIEELLNSSFAKANAIASESLLSSPDSVTGETLLQLSNAIEPSLIQFIRLADFGEIDSLASQRAWMYFIKRLGAVYVEYGHIINDEKKIFDGLSRKIGSNHHNNFHWLISSGLAYGLGALTSITPLGKHFGSIVNAMFSNMPSSIANKFEALYKSELSTSVDEVREMLKRHYGRYLYSSQKERKIIKSLNSYTHNSKLGE